MDNMNTNMPVAETYATLVGLVACRTAIQHLLNLRQRTALCVECDEEARQTLRLVFGVLETGAAALNAAASGKVKEPCDQQLAILADLTIQLRKMEEGR